MGKRVNVIVDASGSMQEEGKNAVVKYILNGIHNLQEKEEWSGVPFQLFQWGKETERLESFYNVKINYAGQADCKGLEALLHDIGKNGTILLISDGNFTRKEKEAWKRAETEILPIGIGIDVNKALLRELSAENRVYSAVDFVQAVKNCI